MNLDKMVSEGVTFDDVLLIPARSDCWPDRPDVIPYVRCAGARYAGQYGLHREAHYNRG